MEAIRTHYLPITNTKPSRIKADDGDGNSITITYPYGYTAEEVFKAAAVALCTKMGWKGELIGGGYKNDYYWIFKS